MKEEFDFKQIGKKMPYQVPENFFEHIPGNIIAENRRRKTRKSVIIPFKRWFSIAAAVVMAGGIWLLYYRTQPVNSPIAQELRQSDTIREKIISGQKTEIPVKPKFAEPVKDIRLKKNEPKPEIKENVSSKPSPKATVETLDEALQNVSDSELAQLANLAENDVITEE